ncbi:hypothetical protein GOBAR_DD13073 [Gossypium barbadense]|nr:hypothetical protein GOBAR_DD13073 [Gossypium barbadense]
MIGVGKIKQYSNILEKPLSKGKQEVSLSAFAFLFSELIQYNQTRLILGFGMMLSSVNGSSIVNESNIFHGKWIRLEDEGYAVGAELLSCWGLSLQAGKAKA